MVAANFDRSLALVLQHEGGYVDHPKDPGGATNLGITISVLKASRGRAVTKADVKALTRAEAAAIYRANYWDKIRGDDLPSGVDYCVFDFAVNSGIGRAAPYLQNELGVEADGKIGPATIAAAKAASAAAVINGLCDRRLAFLKRLKTWATFGKGWDRRVAGVRKEALKMAAGAPPVPVQPRPDDPGPNPTPANGDEDDPTYPVGEGFWAALVRVVLRLLGKG